MNEEELEIIQCLIDHIEFLQDYARRISLGQLKESDLGELKLIREHVKKAKKVFVCL